MTLLTKVSIKLVLLFSEESFYIVKCVNYEMPNFVLKDLSVNFLLFFLKLRGLKIEVLYF